MQSPGRSPARCAASWTAATGRLAPAAPRSPASAPTERLQGGDGSLDLLVGRRGARGHADPAGAGEPGRLKLRRRLDVMRAALYRAAELRQPRGVGAVAAADHDDHVDLGGQLAGGALALLRGVADGVEHEHLAGDGRQGSRHAGQVGARLGGLHHDADALAAQLRERQAGGVLDDHGALAGEALEAGHLGVVTLSEDDHRVAVLTQAGRLTLRDGHERTGRVDQVDVLARAPSTTSGGTPWVRTIKVSAAASRASSTTRTPRSSSCSTTLGLWMIGPSDATGPSAASRASSVIRRARSTP